MELTLQEAWTDFVFGLHRSGQWDAMTRQERQYMDKANREIKRGGLPIRKVQGLFDKYAPCTYQCKEIIFTKL